jgi:hypothetical protein
MRLVTTLLAAEVRAVRNAIANCTANSAASAPASLKRRSEGLSRVSWKLSRTVLRGAVGGNADCLLDRRSHPVRSDRVHWEEVKRKFLMISRDIEQCEENLKTGRGASLGSYDVEFDVEEYPDAHASTSPSAPSRG